MGRRVGLYGGTFDPFHLGHLSLVISMQEAENLEEVWLLPAGQNPLRESGSAVSFAHRLAMTERAIEDVPHLVVQAIEGEREGPSYTIETVLSLKKTYPEEQFSLILGDDVAADLHRWHRVEELLEEVNLLVGDRGSSIEWDDVKRYPKIWTAIEAGRRPTPRYDISATEIRKRLAEDRYCGHLLPYAVLAYSKQHNLYRREYD